MFFFLKYEFSAILMYLIKLTFWTHAHKSGATLRHLRRSTVVTDSYS